jgi:hypothetical protein
MESLLNVQNWITLPSVSVPVNYMFSEDINLLQATILSNTWSSRLTKHNVIMEYKCQFLACISVLEKDKW